MADLDTRVINTTSSKGQVSTQTYLTNTVKTSTTTPPDYVEDREQQGVQTGVKTTQHGTVTETRTTSGVGKTSTKTEDKGVVLKFRLQLQQRNPVTRVT